MVNATHFLDVRLAVDYGQVFSPDNIKGIKFILGLNTDDEVMAHINNEIVNSISDALVKKSAFVVVTDALINAVPQAENEVLEESFSSHEESNDEPWIEGEPELETDYEASSVDTLETDNLLDNGAEDEFAIVETEDDVQEEVQIEEELIELSDALNNDIFMNTAFSATNLEVYLYKYEEYGDRLRDVIDSSIPIRDLSNLLEEVEDFGEVDYVIKYTDVSGEVKYGKRKLNNENTKKENV